MRLASHAARMAKRHSYRFWWGKPEGQKLFGKPRRRCENNIKKDLKEIGKVGVDYIHLDQDRDT